MQQSNSASFARVAELQLARDMSRSIIRLGSPFLSMQLLPTSATPALP